MTREEAIGNLLRHLWYTVDSTDALIKALDQETCEDVISRQAVLDVVESYSESQSNVEDVTQDMISDILALPPVTQQPKTGHWVSTGGMYFICSECGEPAAMVDVPIKKAKAPYLTEWCPKCGAKG